MQSMEHGLSSAAFRRSRSCMIFIRSIQMNLFLFVKMNKQYSQPPILFYCWSQSHEKSAQYRMPEVTVHGEHVIRIADDKVLNHLAN